MARPEIKWYTLQEMAKLFHTNYRGCQNAGEKMRRLSERMAFMGDAGVFPVKDDDGNEWEVCAGNDITNITEWKKLDPDYKSAFER